MLLLLKKMTTNSIQYLFINVQRHQPDGYKQRQHNVRTQNKGQ